MQAFKKEFLNYKKISTLTFFFIISTSLFYFVSQIDKQNNIEIIFLDVDQGDSSLIKTASNQKILIDTGASYVTTQKLQKYLPLFSKSLDAVILTHPDLDHVGGTQEILDTNIVKNLIISTENEYLDYKKKEIKESDLEVLKVNNSNNILLNNDINLEILSPDKGQEGDSNQNSIVNRLVYGNFEFIFMADADTEVERKLVAKGYFENKNTKKVLKVGHHGSDTSSSEIFLKKLKPEYCIISVGKDNKYGHPKKEVIDRLEKYCKNIYRTDKNSDISFTADGANLKIETSK
jgi:competence protein ComEC